MKNQKRMKMKNDSTIYFVVTSKTDKIMRSLGMNADVIIADKLPVSPIPFPEDSNPFAPMCWPQCSVGDKCPACGSHHTCFSYYSSDVEPYPFKGILWECWNCNNLWEKPIE